MCKYDNVQIFEGAKLRINMLTYKFISIFAHFLHLQIGFIRTFAKLFSTLKNGKRF